MLGKGSNFVDLDKDGEINVPAISCSRSTVPLVPPHLWARFLALALRYSFSQLGSHLSWP